MPPQAVAPAHSNGMMCRKRSRRRDGRRSSQSDTEPENKPFTMCGTCCDPGASATRWATRLDRLFKAVHRPAMNPIKPLAAALLIALPHATLAQADTAFSVLLEVKSQGVTMRAPLFVAAGPGPHPTLITFKGFPGGNSSALSRFMQDRGINSVILNFRGQYESDGTYDVAGTALDAAAFVAFLKSDSAVRAFRIDPRRIAISGQSAGSFAALSATANDATIRCSSLVVPFNWAVPLLDMRRSPLVRSAMVAQLNTIAARNTEAVRLDSAFASRSVDIAEQLDLRTAAMKLQGRQMLLVGAKKDATAPLALHFNPVLDSLRKGQAVVRDTTFDDDHNLTGSRDEFFTLQADWIRSCTR
jgi:alpha/beta superfamily hydrolase